MAASTSTFSTLKRIGRRGIGAPIAMLLMLAMMMLPLPPFMLDLLFTFNIALSLVILLAVIYVMRPLEFASFPTVVLFATLLRLALNIASTRVVLLHGHLGPGAAGKVIEAFGEFVIGGNFAVGFVVFAILTIINFVVVTKGATRVSEVTARFTLDAMPGKQMAIDADLNAGLLDPGAGARAPPGSARGSGLLRLDGRRQQVRSWRRHRRHPDPWHQHHRRLLHRHAAARPVRLGGRAYLYAADHRRRPGRPGAGADALDRRGGDRHPRVEVPGDGQACDWPDLQPAQGAGRGRHRARA